MLKSALPSVLIVDNDKGDIFIVENKKTAPQVSKILKNSSFKSEHRIRLEADTELESDIKIENEVVTSDLIIEEYLEEYFEESFDKDEIVQFVDSSKVLPDPKEELVNESKQEESIAVLLDHQYTITENYENHNDEAISMEYEIANYEDSEDVINDESELNGGQFTFLESDEKPKKQLHKYHQLTGKAACKYCETLFRSKELLKAHSCKYLQCDPKNFICRICNKELSKKTFSNHLHETLDCQYCGKNFINPRNLKTHIKNIHKDEEYQPPKSPKQVVVKVLEFVEAEEQTVLDEETGIIVTAPVEKEKKKYVRKKGRFECDLCGRIFTSTRSLQQHILLHKKAYNYMCETCGEKFTTRTGINRHACLNRKRKRPEKDFRTKDVRHCKYCDLWFSSLEDNLNHTCQYQNECDPKVFRCRFCTLDLSKNSFNKHMAKHLDPNDYVCKLCDKKLVDERALITHLTTHSGEKPFVCKFQNCGKSFINKTLLTRHSRFHGVEVPTYRCEVCSREVASKYHLKNHMLMHREDAMCQICKAKFPNRDQLKEHYNISHEPYPCSFCSKTFLLPRYLKMHEKLHMTKTAPQFQCEFCSKQFSKRSLANHVFKVHQENFSEWRDRNLNMI